MIRKLQQLKAKKGFTLVELIVVIAIIGVLAAILIPVMMGFVTSSRVTSADSTAASIQQSIGNFLTECDTAGYGMKLSETSTSIITITVTPGSGSSGAEWTTKLTNTGANGSFKDIENKQTWTAAGEAMDSTAVKADEAYKPTNLLSLYLRDLFPDIQQAAIIAFAKKGNVDFVAYTADSSNIDDLAPFNEAVTSDPYENGVLTKKDEYDVLGKDAKWDTRTAGISGEGWTIGTAPKLNLGQYS